MWLDGVAIDPAASYSVTVNSFLGTGGDNFFELANGANKVDTGKIDLAAMVDFMAQFTPRGSPLQVDYSQRAVEVEFPGAAPEAYAPGDTVEFNVVVVDHVQPQRRQGHRSSRSAGDDGARHGDAGQHDRKRAVRQLRHRGGQLRAAGGARRPATWS